MDFAEKRDAAAAHDIADFRVDQRLEMRPFILQPEPHFDQGNETVEPQPLEVEQTNRLNFESEGCSGEEFRRERIWMRCSERQMVVG